MLCFSIIALTYRVMAFIGPTPKFRIMSSVQSTVSEYTLEGKKIQKPFTPVNNMLLLKKAEIVDQTGGGIFLTGKVSSPEFLSFSFLRVGASTFLFFTYFFL